MIAAWPPALATPPPCRPAHIADILAGVERYNPDRIQDLEAYLEAQCKNGDYDCLANLALLKLYQFNPDLRSTESITDILVKAMAAFPLPDFALSLHLLPPSVLRASSTDPLAEAVQKLFQAYSALEEADFPTFWELLESDDLYADLTAETTGFEAEIRKSIARALAQSHKEIDLSILESYLNLSGKELVQLCGRLGWTVCDDIVQIPENSYNQPKSSLFRENIKFEQLSKLLQRAVSAV